MGIETALIVVAAGATAAEASSQISAANSQEKALQLQGKLQEVQYQEQSLNNINAVEKVIDAQKAAMTVTGAAFSSPSFNAIQRNTLNIGAKNQRNLDIRKSIIDQNIEYEKENVRNTLFAQLFGDAANLAMKGAGIANSMPVSNTDIPTFEKPKKKDLSKNKLPNPFE